LWIIIALFMGPKDILERTASSKAVEFAPPETEYGLNVALVYQDIPTRKWATQVCDQVAQLAGKDAVHCSSWEINRLSDPEMLMDAILMTLVADVIMVSIYDAKELPIELCAWFNAWMPYRSLPTGALIALINVPGQPGAQTNHARDYLRSVARVGRLDFLLREQRRLPEASRGYFYMEKLAEWTNPTTSVIQEALSHEHGDLSLFNAP